MSLPKLMPYYLFGKMELFGSVIVQLSGEKLNDVFDFPLKGMDIFDIMSPEEKDIVSKLHGQMIGQPCGVYTIRNMKKETGYELSLATYSFPLISKDGENYYFLMYYEDQTTIDENTEINGKLSSLSIYSDLEFVDLGNGIPSTQELHSELSNLRGTG